MRTITDHTSGAGDFMKEDKVYEAIWVRASMSWIGDAQVYAYAFGKLGDAEAAKRVLARWNRLEKPR